MLLSVISLISAIVFPRKKDNLCISSYLHWY